MVIFHVIFVCLPKGTVPSKSCNSLASTFSATGHGSLTRLIAVAAATLFGTGGTGGILAGSGTWDMNGDINGM